MWLVMMAYRKSPDYNHPFQIVKKTGCACYAIAVHPAYVNFELVQATMLIRSCVKKQEMKKYIYFISALVFAASCDTKDKKQEPTTADSVSTATDSAAINADSHYFWAADFDGKNGLLMKRLRPVSKDSLTTQNVIGMLNEIYPDIPLELVKTSHDSIFIKISKSTYLTQQTGSSGAEAYLAEATYNLTEIAGVNFVNFQFKQGDHAAPGTYSRTDFIQER
jgi:hypothetical protein